MNCILRGVRVIDPARARDTPGQDVWLSEGRLIAMYPHIDEGTVPVIDLTRGPGLPQCILAPGLIDLHAHLREPGDEDAETTRTGADAAARGGFTEVVAMANTRPPVDSAARVAEALARGRGLATRIHPVAAVSRDLAGHEAVDVEACADAGAIAFSDDGRNAAGEALLADVLSRAGRIGRAVLVHPEDEGLIVAANPPGLPVARAPHRPAEAEAAAVSTALAALRRAPGGRLHLQHLSTAASVDEVRRAREDGLAVTAEVTPHHLAMWLPVARVPDPPALLKVNPPLRRQSDREALVQGLRDGVIDAVATDHAPHRADEKSRPLAEAAPGMTGLETALATCVSLGAMGGDWIPVLLERLSGGPHRVLGTGTGRRQPGLHIGEAATCLLFDPGAEWTVGAEAQASLSRNTPLAGTPLRGRVLLTICDGVITHQDSSRLPSAATFAEAYRSG